MSRDGSVERLLNDNEIGWQAGNWEVNTRSVAICLDGDFREQDPPEKMLETTADIIRKNYPSVSKEKIVGHREVNEKTDCPGTNFLSGWKNELVERIWKK